MTDNDVRDFEISAIMAHPNTLGSPYLISHAYYHHLFPDEPVVPNCPYGVIKGKKQAWDHEDQAIMIVVRVSRKQPPLDLINGSEWIRHVNDVLSVESYRETERVIIAEENHANTQGISSQ